MTFVLQYTICTKTYDLLFLLCLELLKRTRDTLSLDPVREYPVSSK